MDHSDQSTAVPGRAPADSGDLPELEQVGWGGCIQQRLIGCDDKFGHAWGLVHEDDGAALDPDHPIWPVYRRRDEAEGPVNDETHAFCVTAGQYEDALTEVAQAKDRADALEARVQEQDEDLSDWKATYEDLLAEHQALREFSRSMAAAIGWDETPGDSWVEKALNWRQDPESLPGLYAELNHLRSIANGLVDVDPARWLEDANATACVLCGAENPDAPEDHEHDCPWAQAKSWAADHPGERSHG